MSRLLFVTGFRPSPEATSSGQKLSFKLLSELARTYDSIDLVYWVNDIDFLDVHSAIELPENISVTAVRLTFWQRALAYFAYFRLPAFASARRLSAGHVIARLIESGRHSSYYADFAQGLAGVPSKYWPLFDFRQHDIISKLYERRMKRRRGPSRLFFWIEASRCTIWQNRAWKSVKSLMVLSLDDRHEIAANVERDDICVADPESLLTIEPNVSTRSPVRGRIIFWGNMARSENEDAATWFVSSIFPLVKRHYPSAHFHIVGAHPTHAVRRLAREDVVVTGFVDDPGPEFSSAAVAVAPLRVGSGVKIKVIETLACHIPTVATPVGAEGVPPTDLLVVADGPTAIAEAIVRELENA